MGAAGLSHVRFHDLRHLAGTEAATTGASLREVMSIMVASRSVWSATAESTGRGASPRRRRDRTNRSELTSRHT